MKKVYTTIFLFISLFFFISTDVKADTYNLLINESSMSLINDDFLRIRELSLTYCEENNINYYYIYSDSTGSQYYVIFFDSVSSYNMFRNSVGIFYNLNIGNSTIYSLSNEILLEYAKTTAISKTLKIDDTTNIIYFYEYLDTNYDLVINDSNIYNITYNNYTYIGKNNENLVPLYNYYLNGTEKEEEVSEEHLEQLNVLSSFYNLAIEKITLLANSIINNYIILSFVGIIILIFIIELIRRYLL